MLKEVNIFKAGLQTAESGMSRDFTLSELDEIVNSYDPTTHEAPIRIGHEDNDKVPAWGWVRGLVRKGEDLYAKIDFSPLAKEFIKNGLYKKVSASFYSPVSKINPHPGKWSLRHVALLGAQPPAVKGLKGFAYEEPPSECWSFSIQLDPEQVYDSEFGPTLKKHMSPLQMLKEKIDMAKEKMTEEVDMKEKAEVVKETSEEMVMEMKEKAKKKKAEEEVEVVEEVPEVMEEVVEEAPEEMEMKEKDKKKKKAEEEVEVVEEAPEVMEEVVEETSEEMEMKEKDKKKKKAEEEVEVVEEAPEVMEMPEEVEEVELKEKKAKKAKKSAPISKKDLSSEVDKEVSKLLKELDIDVEEMGEELVEEVDMDDYKKEKSKKVNSFSEMGNPDLEKVLSRIKELEEANSRLKADVEFAEKKAFRTSLQRFTDTLYESGKLTDSVINQDELIDYMEGLEYGTYQFSEGESIITPLVNLLNRLPQMVSYEEFAPESKAVVPEPTDPHEKALTISREEGISYSEALKKALFG